LGSGAITDGETDAKNASVDDPLIIYFVNLSDCLLLFYFLIYDFLFYWRCRHRPDPRPLVGSPVWVVVGVGALVIHGEPENGDNYRISDVYLTTIRVSFNCTIEFAFLREPKNRSPVFCLPVEPGRFHRRKVVAKVNSKKGRMCA
jgi:hypothetical protein